jgi:hypothetical protein
MSPPVISNMLLLKKGELLADAAKEGERHKLFSAQSIRLVID